MEGNKDGENQRAYRISIRLNECHILLSDVYENLVDRNFKSVDKDVKTVIIQLRLILKSMEDDDF